MTHPLRHRPSSPPAPAPRPARAGHAVLPLEEAAAAAVLTQARRRLMRADPRLAAVMRTIGACGLRRRPGGFSSLFRSILYQQLSGKAAATIAARVHLACGGVAAAESLAGLDDAAFAAAGVSRQKRDYLRGLALAALAAPERFDRLELLTDEAVVDDLTALKGIGRWTAEMYLLFSLGRLDVLPLGDLSIRAAIAELHDLSAGASPAAAEAAAAAWKPYRSVACWYLYAHLDRRRRPETPTIKS